MTPEQRSAYDSYVPWMESLATFTGAITEMPLDELLAANARITLVGVRLVNGSKGAVDPVATARQKRLIEAAIVFRNTVCPPATEGAADAQQ